MPILASPYSNRSHRYSSSEIGNRYSIEIKKQIRNFARNNTFLKLMIKCNIEQIDLLTIEKNNYPVTFFFYKDNIVKILKTASQPAIKRREEKENRLVLIFQAHPPRDLSSD